MIERLRPPVPVATPRVALFDFDGTLSLVRAGWVDLMAEMMVEILAGLGTGEADASLRRVAEEEIRRLAGRATMQQMIALAALVATRGGAPLDPEEYKRRYLDRLGTRIAPRLAALATGRADPDEYLVPGARAFLETLRARRVVLYLASGTDEPRVREEAALLDIARYFDGGLHGARAEDPAFSKTTVIEGIVASGQARAAELLVFGDGDDEITSARRAGAVAVGLATDEAACRAPDPEKRRRLTRAGADLIVANYLEPEPLLAALFPG